MLTRNRFRQDRKTEMTAHRFKNKAPSSLPKADFVGFYGGVYEHSPWIAEAAHDAGLQTAADTAAGLSATLRAVVEAADRARQLSLLRAHPDLAGKLALGGGLTAESTSEQAGAGLDRCTPVEFERFQTLNRAYREKFDFPFILAVKGYQRGEILAIFERRLEHDLEQELREALDQVHRIAYLRLCALAEAQHDAAGRAKEEMA